MDSNEASMLIFRFSESLKRFFANNLTPSFKVNATGGKRLSERQYHILFLMEYSSADTLSALADMLCLSPSGLSTIVKKMAINGLITKDYPAADEDGRSVIFKITPEGRNALRELTNEFLENIKTFHSRLSNDNLVSFLEGYDMIRTAVLGEPTVPAVKTSAFEFAKNIFNDVIAIKRLFNAKFIKHFAGGACQSPRLTPGQFHILCIIRDFNVRSLSALSRFTGLSESTLSIAIKNLEKHGYIRKEIPEDARRMEFYITDSGLKELCQIRGIFLEEFKAFYNSLDDPRGFFLGIEKLSAVFARLGQ